MLTLMTVNQKSLANVRSMAGDDFIPSRVVKPFHYTASTVCVR